MKDATFTQSTSDGVALHVHGFLPEDRTTGVVHIVHGMAEHGGRYARLAETLTAAGFAVYAHDQRGHGKSIPSGHAAGHIAAHDGFGALVRDTHEVNRAIANRHPALPIVLFGHSMGSFVSQAMLFQHPKDFVGCILSASNGAPPLIARAARGIARAERFRLGPVGKSALLHRLSFVDFNSNFAPNRTAADWLSRDPAEVDKYVADPLCGFEVDTQFWVDFLDALDVNIHLPANQAKIPKDLPLFLLAGDRDPVGDFGKGVRKLFDEYRRAGISDLSITLYPGGRHEMVNETNRDQVTSDILAFVTRVTARA